MVVIDTNVAVALASVAEGTVAVFDGSVIGRVVGVIAIVSEICVAVIGMQDSGRNTYASPTLFA